MQATTLFQFSAGLGIGVAMLLVTLFIHYEGLSLLSRHFLSAKKTHPRRTSLLAIVLSIFALHFVEIFLYAVAFFLTALIGLGGLHFIQDIPAGEYGIHYMYYASVVYTSVGFGEVLPTGSLRILSGVAGLNGLLLIAWSASFTYLSMEKLWRQD